MKIRIIQTGLREFRDVYEYDLTHEQYALLKQNLKQTGRTLSEIEDTDAYELGFDLSDPVESEQGDILDDQTEIELVRTKKNVLEVV
jgi:hypothetical protein